MGPDVALQKSNSLKGKCILDPVSVWLRSCN